jgi:calcium-dependent protein kinase
LYEQVIAEHLSVEEAAGLKEGFKLMDTSNKGKINIDELRVGLHKLGHQIPDADVQILMEAVSFTFTLCLDSIYSPHLIFKN